MQQMFLGTTGLKRRRRTSHDRGETQHNSASYVEIEPHKTYASHDTYETQSKVASHYKYEPQSTIASQIQDETHVKIASQGACENH